MPKRRIWWWLGAAAALLLVGGMPASAQEDPGEDVAWLATGDSYSSGEGITGNQGNCAQSDLAYAQVAAAPFGGVDVFTACTGHLAADYFGSHEGSDESLWEWGEEQRSGQRYDVVTLTFGGNDIGFESVITDCLNWYPESWDELLVGSRVLDDCDVTEEELQRRIDRLVNAPSLRIHPSDANQMGNLSDFYRAVADHHLSPRGQLYILGYPRLFAPSDEWGLWQGARCNGVTRGDANMLGRVAEYLSASLRRAAAEADDGTGRTVYLPVIDLFRDGSHELCGNGKDWINGSITLERDPTRAGFHPTGEGHSAEAELLLAHLQDPERGLAARRRNEPPTWDELAGAEIPAMCGHEPTRLVGGEHVGLAVNDGMFRLRTEVREGGPALVALPDTPDGPLTAVVAQCNAGGVSWPDPILFFGPAPEYHSHTFLDDFDWEPWELQAPARNGITAIRPGQEGRLIVELDMYRIGEGGCCWSGWAIVALEVDGGEVRVTEVLSASKPDPLDRSDPQAVADAFFEAWEAGDTETMAELAANEVQIDADWTPQGFTDEMTCRDGAEFLSQLCFRYDDGGLLHYANVIHMFSSRFGVDSYGIAEGE